MIRKNTVKIFAYIGVVILLFGIITITRGEEEIQDKTAASSMAREELEEKIQERAKELEDLRPRLEEAQQQLSTTQNEKSSLQRDLNNIQGNINQLNLSLRADELTADKLSLEIKSLELDTIDIKSSIETKRVAIGQILNEIMHADQKGLGLLATFLRNKSLAEGVLEAQTLANFQAQLAIDITNLRALSDDYVKMKEDASKKHSQVVYHQDNLQNKKIIIQDQKSEREILLKVTKNKESVYRNQLSELESLQEKIADEIEALDAVLRTKIDPATLPPIVAGVLEFPVNVGRNFITQGYGSTDFAKATYRGNWHNGIDIGSPIGTPILAAEDGEVVGIGDQDKYCPRAAYGKFLVIKHNNNLVTLYGHMSRHAVKKGDTVTRGQVIGYMGRTGWATGSHLHFVVFAGPTYYMGLTKSCGPMPYGGDLNPLGYL
ncbi:MAG: peptidoglycan DD-metalloendopeptidase family protein [Patescibacteria group bacterium]|nr:peptidoglycan DD-metalloendopeptidase family protein [Patescibacteria group bacterium]